jgi:hypothetical protein
MKTGETEGSSAEFLASPDSLGPLDFGNAVPSFCPVNSGRQFRSQRTNLASVTSSPEAFLVLIALDSKPSRNIVSCADDALRLFP